MRKLNGWQRLWLVVIVLWGFWVIGFTVQNMPTEARYRAAWARIATRTDDSPVERARELATIEKGEAEIRESLLTDQLEMLGASFGIWAVCSALLYGLGLLIRWVIRGFKSST